MTARPLRISNQYLIPSRPSFSVLVSPNRSAFLSTSFNSLNRTPTDHHHRRSPCTYEWHQPLTLPLQSLLIVSKQCYVYAVSKNRNLWPKGESEVGQKRKSGKTCKRGLAHIPKSVPKSVAVRTRTDRSFCTLPMISTAWLSWRCESFFILHQFRFFVNVHHAFSLSHKIPRSITSNYHLPSAKSG
jgi:hypothetical protein